jgi:hypothetical protein
MSGTIECVNCDSLGAPASAVSLSPDQAYDLIQKTMGDLAALEMALSAWQGSIFRTATAGLMTCGEIREYNQYALATWGWERQVLANIHNAVKGTSVEAHVSKFVPREPHDPVLFGHSMSAVGGVPTVSLNCPDGSFVDPSTLRQFGQPSSFPCASMEEPYSRGNTLSGVVAVCASGPQAALGCLIVGVFTYAVVKQLANSVETIFLGADKVNLELAKLRVQAYAKRQIMIETCVTAALQRGVTGPALADVRAKCAATAIKAIPDPASGLAATSFTRNLIVLTAVVGVGVIGGIVAWTFYKKGRKSGGGEKSSSASSKPALKRVA